MNTIMIRNSHPKYISVRCAQLLAAVALSLAMPLSSHAQTMRQMLEKMPDTVVPLLSHNNVLDCMDNYDAGMPADAINNMQGKTTMTEYTEDYVHFNLTAASTLSMKLLSAKGAKVVCVVNTSATHMGKVSTVRFYTTEWESVPTSDYVQMDANAMVEAVLSKDAATLQLIHNRVTLRDKDDKSSVAEEPQVTTVTFE